MMDSFCIIPLNSNEILQQFLCNPGTTKQTNRQGWQYTLLGFLECIPLSIRQRECTPWTGCQRQHHRDKQPYIHTPTFIPMRIKLNNMSLECGRKSEHSEGANKYTLYVICNICLHYTLYTLYCLQYANSMQKHPDWESNNL